MKQLIQSLNNALSEEIALLDKIEELAQKQLQSLERRNIDAMSDTTEQLRDTNSNLDRLKETKKRQLRLLRKCTGLSSEANLLNVARQIAHQYPEAGSRLLALANDVKKAAASTSARLSDLEEAMEFAASVGRRIVINLQNANGLESSSVYTATGTTRRSTLQRSLVNKVS